MHRILAVAFLSGATCITTMILCGASLISYIWMPPVVSSFTILVWVIAVLAADRTYRPRMDAAAMMQGVCPDCRTFNSLQEVTSDDPDVRSVDCLACKQQYHVRLEGDHFTAERLGKSDD